MTLTSQVIDELVKVTPPQSSARSAEIAALLRFAGSLEVVGGTLEVSAEFSRAVTAERLVTLIRDFLDIPCAIRGLPGYTTERRDPVYRVEVASRTAELVRKLGLITRSGHRIVGLPPQVISGDIVDIEAAWRGAFLAAGTLVEPGRSTSIEVTAPGMEAGLALVGCARRLGMSAKTRESRGIDKVLVKEPDAIGALLTRMGAHVTRMVWQEKLRSRENQNQARLTNFDDANLRRSARAAEVAAARVTRALDILGEDVPEHLAEAGYLRLQHQDASLEELGRLSDPQLTKDAVAGRIRRLLSMADRQAEEMGIPDTRAAVPQD